MIIFVKGITGIQKGKATIIDTEFDTWAFTYVKRNGVYEKELDSKYMEITREEYEEITGTKSPV